MAKLKASEAQQFSAWVIGLFSLGLLLRFYQIGELEFWLDEALTGYLAHSEDWLLRVHNSPPLYFLAARAWSGLFGLEEGSLRALSALSSGLLIPLAMYTGRTIFSRDAGIAAGILVLLSPISIYYAQEARPYALLVTELMFVYWMLWRTEFEGGGAAWALLLCGTTAAIYTHNLAVIPLALGYLLAIAYAWHQKRWKQLRLYFVVGWAAVFLYVPWFLWWLDTTEFHPEDMLWLARLWGVYATWRLPIDSIFSFYHAATIWGDSVVGKQFAGQPALTGMPLLSIAAMLGLCGLTGHAVYRNATARIGASALVLLLIFPLLALVLVSFWKPVYLPGRYDLIAYPAFILLCGFALAWLRNRLRARYSTVLAHLLCAVFLVPPAVRALQFYGSANQASLADVATYIDGHVEENDLVLMEEGRGIGTVYYLQLIGYSWKDGRCINSTAKRAFTCRFLPTAMESAPAAITRHMRAQRNQTMARDAVRIVQERPYDDIYLLVKRVDLMEDRLSLNRSIAPVLAELQRHGYSIDEARPNLNVLRLGVE